MDVPLPRYLLGEREDPLDAAEVDEDVPRVLALLDDAGDDVALPALEVAQDRLVLEVAQALDDHLAGRRRGDPAEPLRSVVELRTRLATLGPLALLRREQLALLACPDDDVAGLPVQLDPGEAVAALGAVIRDEKGLLTGGFAVLAWPEKYGNSGVMTFMISHRGVAWQKDLGPETATLAPQITAFDPGEGWSVTPDELEAVAE